MYWRKWKKSVLRNLKWRGNLKLLSVCILISFCYTTLGLTQAFAASEDLSLSEIYDGKKTIKVIHHRTYVCGEEVEEIGRLTFEQTLEIMANHPEWEITTDDNRAVIRLKESISDLSSYCKENAYFGISTINDFSLFDGYPEKNKVIKTFFQLNVPYMESTLDAKEWKKLKDGIKVHSIDEYESVISTFSEYSTEKSDLVCRPYY